jgi:hypothetical protein
LGPRHPPENAEVALWLIFGRTNPMFVNEINVEMKSRDIVDHCPEAVAAVAGRIPARRPPQSVAALDDPKCQLPSNKRSFI